MRSISQRIRTFLTGKDGESTSKIVGYSAADLVAHLERQFLRGMSWDNYGEWHVDHIIPLSSFKAESFDDPDVKRAWSLPNLRPIWKFDNIAKSNRRTHLI
jgi:hypothetical protein